MCTPSSVDVVMHWSRHSTDCWFSNCCEKTNCCSFRGRGIWQSIRAELSEKDLWNYVRNFNTFCAFWKRLLAWRVRRHAIWIRQDVIIYHQRFALVASVLWNEWPFSRQAG